MEIMGVVFRCQALSLNDMPKRQRSVTKSCGSSPSSVHAGPFMRPRSPHAGGPPIHGHGLDAGPAPVAQRKRRAALVPET